MFELFADIFTYRENALLKTDPRTKLIVSVWAIVLIICSKDILYPLSVFIFSMAFLTFLRIPARVIVGRMLVPLGIVLVIILLKLFMTPGEPLFTVSFLNITLNSSREGLLSGINIGARVIGSVSLIVLLGVTTPAHEVFRSLLWMKAPRDWVEVAMLMYRYIFVLIDTTINMAMAQKLRLGYSGMFRALRSLGVLSGVVVLRSVDQSVKTSEAMMLRGYNGSFPVSRLPLFTRSDFRITFLFCSFFAALFGVSEWMLG